MAAQRESLVAVVHGRDDAVRRLGRIRDLMLRLCPVETRDLSLQELASLLEVLKPLPLLRSSRRV